MSQSVAEDMIVQLLFIKDVYKIKMYVFKPRKKKQSIASLTRRGSEAHFLLLYTSSFICSIFRSGYFFVCEMNTINITVSD